MVWRSLDRYPRSNSTVSAYLLHFSAPLGHAQHYIGVTYADDIEERLTAHRTGQGATICKRAVQAGIELLLARVWPNVPRYTEQRLKNRGGASRLCPICQGRTEASVDGRQNLGTSTNTAEPGELGGGERKAAGV